MASTHSAEFYDKCRDKCDSCKKALKQCYEYMASPDFLKKALTYEINDVLLTSDYKVEHLQIALGTVLSQEMRCAWYKRSSVDYTQMIPLADENNPEKFEAMELFAYPEQSVEGELLFHMFDYTHILTNIRSHILTRKYDYCKKEDFEWIVDNTTGILS